MHGSNGQGQFEQKETKWGDSALVSRFKFQVSSYRHEIWNVERQMTGRLVLASTELSMSEWADKGRLAL